MLRLIIIAIAFSVCGFTAEQKSESTCPREKRHYRTAFRHIERGGIGYEDGYTTFEAFLGLDPSLWNIIPFIDARGHVFDNGKWAANAGLGCRALWGSRAYGINAYYDYRNGGGWNANQVGAGLETLGELFDFRINGYLPFGKKITAPYDTAFANFSGNYMYVFQKYKSAMKGANAEFGFHFGKSEFFDFYAAAGPYYFIGEQTPATWGGKARVAGTYKDIFSLEISDSYDRTFHNRFQGQIGFCFSFGPKSKLKKEGRTCKGASKMNDRMLQPVYRQEIIVIDKLKKKTVAIDPATGLPYFFVFVDNTSSSNGTYESPYHSFAQAQQNSSLNDIIYVFPGNGTTAGMNEGITLKANQKLWGSGVNHAIQTSVGTVDIPQQSNTSPKITNVNLDTDGHAVILGANNAVSGFTILSAISNAIYGTDLQSLEVSSCKFENTTTFPIEATFPANASASITNNQFSNNANGIFLKLFGLSNVVCSNNLFEGQTSPSEVPIQIASDSNTLTTVIENNIIRNNATGSIRFAFTSIANSNITIRNNTITNNDLGSQSSLASSVVFIQTGINEYCSIGLMNNTFSENGSNALYLHTSGSFTSLAVSASANTMSNNGGSALVLATPADTLTLLAANNTITTLNDNGISIIGSGTTSTGSITINNNSITNIGNSSNGIAINQNFTTLNLDLLDNEISGCEGTGILSFAPASIASWTLDISGNTISDCQNVGSGNAASGISLDNYLNLTATVANNNFSNNPTPSVAFGLFSSGNPNVCLTLTGNSCDINPSYSFTNPGSGAFHLAPCDVDTVNVGTINLSGTIDHISSCPGGDLCPP